MTQQYNPEYIDSIFEAQRASGEIWQCDGCQREIKGPLPGFPVWWQPTVGYSVLGYVTCACGGRYHKREGMSHGA